MRTCVEGNPTLITEPLHYGSPERRIKTALGQMQGRLPGVTLETLQAYYAHLARHLSFPFTARYPEPVGLHSEVIRSVVVVGIRNPADRPGLATCTGIVCRVRAGNQESDVPLADLEVEPDDPNYELIEDYWYWFWNWR
jgi:hypothetical protein